MGRHSRRFALNWAAILSALLFLAATVALAQQSTPCAARQPPPHFRHAGDVQPHRDLPLARQGRHVVMTHDVAGRANVADAEQVAELVQHGQERRSVSACRPSHESVAHVCHEGAEGSGGSPRSHAAQEMGADPPKPPCRRRLQTTQLLLRSRGVVGSELGKGRARTLSGEGRGVERE